MDEPSQPAEPAPIPPLLSAPDVARILGISVQQLIARLEAAEQEERLKSLAPYMPAMGHMPDPPDPYDIEAQPGREAKAEAARPYEEVGITGGQGLEHLPPNGFRRCTCGKSFLDDERFAFCPWCLTKLAGADTAQPGREARP